MARGKLWSTLTEQERQERAAVNRAKRMEQVDAMPADLRALVHTYGLYVVHAFLQAGVTKPARIKHLVETVLDEFSPTRGSYARQGVRTEVRHD